MTRKFKFAGLRYPRSVLKLLLLGFGLVSLPLILALLNATAYVDRLTTHSRKADQGDDDTTRQAVEPDRCGERRRLGSD